VFDLLVERSSFLELLPLSDVIDTKAGIGDEDWKSTRGRAYFRDDFWPRGVLVLEIYFYRNI